MRLEDVLGRAFSLVLRGRPPCASRLPSSAAAAAARTECELVNLIQEVAERGGKEGRKEGRKRGGPAAPRRGQLCGRGRWPRGGIPLAFDTLRTLHCHGMGSVNDALLFVEEGKIWWWSFLLAIGSLWCQ